MDITFNKLTDNAILPVKSHNGYDLFSTETYDIFPGHRCVVSTGISVNIPRGYMGMLTSVAGMAVKDGLAVLNTTVQDGEIRVILFNHDPEYIVNIKPGYRISTLALVPMYQERVHFNVTGI
jgi:dUTP pyrophosphatase